MEIFSAFSLPGQALLYALCPMRYAIQHPM
jgi:hypothetical protein